LPKKGQKTPLETRLKQSMAALGKEKSPEHRAAMSDGRRGMKLSPSHRANISNSLTASYSEGRRTTGSRRTPEKKKMIRACRNMIHRCLAMRDTDKSRRTHELLGYSAQELVDHLSCLFEENMSWENYGFGDGKWVIDHIKPISRWSLESNLSEINALSNLRPMWWRKNLLKGAKEI
jgi:hypothetical protein